MKTSVTMVPERRDRLLKEHLHDPYKTTRKLPEPTVCPMCSAVFQNGRWAWAQYHPINAHSHVCSACHRIQDDYAAGIVLIFGFAGTIDEIVRLARNIEKLEQGEHPLRRIIKIEETADKVTITTTDVHLPHQIGDALQHAFKGKMETHYDLEGYFSRITIKCPS